MKTPLTLKPLALSDIREGLSFVLASRRPWHSPSGIQWEVKYSRVEAVSVDAEKVEWKGLEVLAIENAPVGGDADLSVSGAFHKIPHFAGDVFCE